MRIAIIGGGTAGYMAAAHLTKFVPWAKLYHIYDSHIPSIGVGEGTTPPFVSWVHEITGLDFSALQAACDMTWKYGIRFEQWGKTRPYYLNYFAPIEGAAYHISAAKLAKLLKDYIQAEYLDQKVTHIQTTESATSIHFSNNTTLRVDFVVDATGFPQTKQNNHIHFDGIPTNAAVIRRSQPAAYQIATRAIARPHGWIFVIPLSTSTSYGYVYNNQINSRTDITADFNHFFREDGVRPLGTEKWLTFPNFSQQTFFDGTCFKIGNAAAFLEPLEATAIGVIVLQLRLISFWLINQRLGLPHNGRASAAINQINQHLRQSIGKVALFLSWHYAEGSPFATPFWNHAQQCFTTMLANASPSLQQEFEHFVQVGAHYPQAITTIQEPNDFHHISPPSKSIDRTFGGFLDVGFAQVGYGIGYYHND